MTIFSRHLTRAGAAALFSLFCLSAPALAQLNSDDTGNELFSTTSSGTTTTTALTTAGIVVTVVNITPEKNRRSALRLYLQANPAATQEALALGGGETMEDLSRFFGVSPQNLTAFAALTRAHRGLLTQILADELITDEEVLAFVKAIHASMSAHDALSEDARALEG